MVTFYEKDLREPVPELQARAEIAVTQLTASDIESLMAVYTTRLELEHNPVHAASVRAHLLERFRRRARCFAAIIGERIVHTNWTLFDHMGFGTLDPDVTVPLGDAEAYMSDGYTVGAFRGKRIHSLVNTQMLRLLQQAGYRKAYTQARTDNFSVRKGLEPLGWKLVGVAAFLRARTSNVALVWRVRGTLESFTKNLRRVFILRYHSAPRDTGLPS